MCKTINTKDLKFSDADNEEFIDHCLAISDNLCLSSDERLQKLHQLFHDEALRFHNANVSGRDHDFPESLRIMIEQFNQR